MFLLLCVFPTVLCLQQQQQFSIRSTKIRDRREVGNQDYNYYDYDQDPSVSEQTYCPPRNEAQAKSTGKKCTRKCITNADCQNDRKLCLCDNACGMSCIRPAKECQELPDPDNGQVHLTGRAFKDRAVYTCDEGYMIVGVQKVVCQGSGVWSGEQPTCKHSNGGRHSPYYCSQPPSIKDASHNGSQEQTFFDLDTELSYQCHPGFKRIGFDHAKCFFMNGTAMWYGPDLKCHPTECGPPQMIMHGKATGDCTTFRCQVHYACEPGFVIEGNYKRICQKDGIWTQGDLPVCSPVNCGIPSGPDNGKALFTAVAYKSVVSYQCNFGFMIRGEATRTCESDKKWSGGIPDCVEINCGMPGGGHLPNGWFEGTRTTMGAEIHFKCIEGMVMESHSNMTKCGSDAQWSHPLPKCLAPCIIPEILNGNASSQIGSKVDHGDNFTVICIQNYEAGGEGGVIQCKNGTWSHIPRCSPARCKSLPTPPSNGMIVAPKTGHGATGLYQCKDGYQIKGGNMTRCEYGKWSGITPECEEIYCSFPGYLENGRILLVGNMGLYDYRPYVRRITNDRQIMYDCDKGYILSLGSPQGATCVAGIWSPVVNMSTCHPENHPHIRWLDKRSIRKEELDEVFPNKSSDNTQTKKIIRQQKIRDKRSTRVKLESLDLNEYKIKRLLTHYLRKKREIKDLDKDNKLKDPLGEDLLKHKSEESENEYENEKDCPKLDTDAIKVEVIKAEGTKVVNYNSGGANIRVSCKQGYNLTSTRSKIKCRKGLWRPEDPKCSPLSCDLKQFTSVIFSGASTLLNHGDEKEFKCEKEGLPDQEKRVTTCKFGLLSPIPACPGKPCIVPKLQNGKYSKEFEFGSALLDDAFLDYSCDMGFKKPLENPLQCKDGALVPIQPMCTQNQLKVQPVKTKIIEGGSGNCKVAIEEENLVAFHQDRLVSGEEVIPDGGELFFRCSDIGKFKFVGLMNLSCKSGVLSGGIPTCEGLNQFYNYAKDLPPTVLFRHENGPIAQSNTGKLLVYPATTLHMECLFLKKNGLPRWIHNNSTKKTYPQGWAQGYNRNSGLEYRLSIYHATEQDTGEYTCITPNNSTNTISIQVVAIDCPTVALSPGLVSSTNQTKLGTNVQFSCTNNNSLVGSPSLRCLPTSKWSDLVPSCNNITCPDINTIVEDPVVKKTRTEDGRVFLACPRGFRINGETTTFCQPNGDWSITAPPTCIPIRCRNPRLSKNLRIHKTGPFNAGDMAKYHCKQGYRLEGHPVAFCNNYGNWSNNSPHCVKSCAYPGAAIRGTMDVVKFYYTINETVNYKCTKGTTMKGSATIKCLKTGHWSDEVPVCLE